MIEHVRISERGKNHLVRLKQKTGIDNWNILCRWAFCSSMSEATSPRSEGTSKDAVAIEMTWRTFGGEYSEIFMALLKRACHKQGLQIDKENLESQLWLHLHRGLGYLMSKKEKGIENMLRNEGVGEL